MLPPLPPDPYKALGVDRKAQLPDIRKAYRALAIKCHPDKIVTDDEDVKAKKLEEFQAIQQAWDILQDDKKRTDYDDLVEKHRRYPQGPPHGMPQYPMPNMSMPRRPEYYVHIPSEGLRSHGSFSSSPRYHPPPKPDNYVYLNPQGIRREKKSSRREPDLRTAEEWEAEERRQSSGDGKYKEHKEKPRDRRHDRRPSPDAYRADSYDDSPRQKSSSRKEQKHRERDRVDKDREARTKSRERRKERERDRDREREWGRRSKKDIVDGQVEGKVNEAAHYLAQKGHMPSVPMTERPMPERPMPEKVNRLRAHPPPAPTPPPVDSPHPPPPPPRHGFSAHPYPHADSESEDDVPRSRGPRRPSASGEPMFSSSSRTFDLPSRGGPVPTAPPPPPMGRVRTFHSGMDSQRDSPPPPRRADTFSSAHQGSGRHRSRHVPQSYVYPESEDEKDDRRRARKAAHRSYDVFDEDLSPRRPPMKSRETSGRSHSYRYVVATPAGDVPRAHFSSVNTRSPFTDHDVAYAEYSGVV